MKKSQPSARGGRLSSTQWKLLRDMRDALLQTNAFLAALAQNHAIDPGYERFRGWCAAELDKRNTGKGEIVGMPAAIRAAHISDLDAWVSEPLRRAEAARAACLATFLDGDKNRDVSVRWPALKKEEDWDV